ncbi:MAG: PAS domain-containing sensor histidine kinase [Erythrobacter sp.]|nr:MAG: PAS domain-containing sensor histidine kinase [Erythrobacter sp.]
MTAELTGEQALPPKDLENLRQPLEALYENAPGFIATSSGPDHVFTFANASYRRFVGRDQLLGRSVAEAMPELVEQGVISIIDEVYRTGEPFVGNSMPLMVLNAESGAVEPRYIDVVYQPIRSSTGEVCGLFCEGYDVTDKHEAQETIAALQAQMIHVSRVNAMGTMAATLAHELNQPLCAIGNYISGTKLNDNTEYPVSRYIEALEGIDAASRRAAGIIAHLRELTKRREPDNGVFDLKRSMDECIRLVRASTSRDIRFLDQISAGLTTKADQVQIQQVIINLLMNACEAMQGEGIVTARAWEESGLLIVSIADTGPGVEAEAAEMLFTWSASTKEEGMGLGLAICRTILDLHRGKIWLEHSSSSGAEFRFSLPMI